jgi:hypothetical protein
MADAKLEENPLEVLFAVFAVYLLRLSEEGHAGEIWIKLIDAGTGMNNLLAVQIGLTLTLTPNVLQLRSRICSRRHS